MRNNLNVTFNFDRLKCYDEADGWGSAEPYMWTIFFKIDGTTCRLNDSLMLEGTATIFTTPGSHGNLGDNDVDAGDTVSVPSAIGEKSMVLTPIPVPDSVKQVGIDDVTAIAGCIVVLMEEDNVTDDGADSGHSALNAAVQDALNSIIPTLGVSNQQISDDDIKKMADAIQSKVEDAVKNQQNIFENIWSWLNPDDTIGTKVWKFSGDDLLSNNPVALQERWQKVWHPVPLGSFQYPGYWINNGDWELFGNITTSEIPSCPADVVNDLFENLFGKLSSKATMDAMYRFRDTEMKNYRGLDKWWQIAKSNSGHLKTALNNHETAEAAVSLFKDIPEMLTNKQKPISELQFSNIEKILKQISIINISNRNSRKYINRSIDALHHMKGKTIGEIFKILSKVPPTRYPDLKTTGNALK
ncbi:MAG: hypothetical protein QM763_11450 [Agriterribacter sp.]